MADAVRIDKWLWAARFFKTRALASDAVKGGRVHANGQAVKPSRDVKVGDRLELSLGQTRMVVDVVETSERRGPAAEAQKLYAETPESREARERAADLRRMAGPQPVPDVRGRPTKRDRRRYEQRRRGA